MSLYILAASLYLFGVTIAYQNPSIWPVHVRKSRSTRVNMNPEHLIDCAVNSQIADLYGGVGSPVCIETKVSVFSGLGGLFDEAVTIGFLVMSYFFFKRSANGVIDWIDTEIGTENDYIDIEATSISSARGGWHGDQGLQSRREEEEVMEGTLVCPQCVGTGHFTWADSTDGDDYTTEEVCELCEGTGRIEQISWGRKTFTLPSDMKE